MLICATHTTTNPNQLLIWSPQTGPDMMIREVCALFFFPLLPIIEIRPLFMAERQRELILSRNLLNACLLFQKQFTGN